MSGYTLSVSFIIVVATTVGISNPLAGAQDKVSAASPKEVSSIEAPDPQEIEQELRESATSFRELMGLEGGADVTIALWRKGLFRANFGAPLTDGEYQSVLHRVSYQRAMDATVAFVASRPGAFGGSYFELKNDGHLVVLLPIATKPDAARALLEEARVSTEGVTFQTTSYAFTQLAQVSDSLVELTARLLGSSGSSIHYLVNPSDPSITLVADVANIAEGTVQSATDYLHAVVSPDIALSVVVTRQENSVGVTGPESKWDSTGQRKGGIAISPSSSVENIGSGFSYLNTCTTAFAVEGYDYLRNKPFDGLLSAAHCGGGSATSWYTGSPSPTYVGNSASMRDLTNDTMVIQTPDGYTAPVVMNAWSGPEDFAYFNTEVGVMHLMASDTIGTIVCLSGSQTYLVSCGAITSLGPRPGHQTRMASYASLEGDSGGAVFIPGTTGSQPNIYEVALWAEGVHTGSLIQAGLRLGAEFAPIEPVLAASGTHLHTAWSTIRLKNHRSGLCMTRKSGTNQYEQRTCSTSLNPRQLFYIRPQFGTDLMMLQDVSTSLCIGGPGTAANGSAVSAASCSYLSSSLRFPRFGLPSSSLTTLDDATFGIWWSNRGKCISVLGNSTSAGAALDYWDCGGFGERSMVWDYQRVW